MFAKAVPKLLAAKFCLPLLYSMWCKAGEARH